MATIEFTWNTREVETRLLGTLKKYSERELVHVHETLTEMLHSQAVEHAPVDDGTLKKTSHVKYTGKLTSEVIFPVPYAVYMEFGTGIYVDEDGRTLGGSGQPIYPTNKKVLAWVDSGPRPVDAAGWAQARAEGRAHFAAYVLGSHPTAFLRKAMEWCRVNLKAIVDEAVRTLPQNQI